MIDTRTKTADVTGDAVNILIVDSGKPMLRALMNLLEADHEVRLASGAQEALRFTAEATGPDIVIADERSAAANEGKLIKNIRRRGNGTSILVVRSHPAGAKSARAKLSDVDEIFYEPINVEKLMRSIHRQTLKCFHANPEKRTDTSDDSRPGRTNT